MSAPEHFNLRVSLLNEEKEEIKVLKYLNGSIIKRHGYIEMKVNDNNVDISGYELDMMMMNI